jgi:hypothetical protein
VGAAPIAAISSVLVYLITKLLKGYLKRERAKLREKKGAIIN